MKHTGPGLVGVLFKIIERYHFLLCCFTPNFSVAAPIAETSLQMKYISELVSDLPIVSTFWACDRNVRGTPPMSSIPLSALGVLDGDGLYVPLLRNKVFVFN
ncbi:hypothetical protein SO802_032375 [Lithocarpus litseifolius]|uniref:Uncharacterized protein n=1 Tax=Lithocarpus litseifolius TaxID=425828 RepID=A0AAW2BRM5_9ROSI